MTMLDRSTMRRRSFLQGAAATAAGLTIGFRWTGKPAEAAAAGGVFAPNAFVHIAPDDSVTVIIKHLEMGQGVNTGLATILAEELDADWAQIRVEAAPADKARYANLKMGVQGTGGSSAISNSWEQLRKAGATARAVLVAAAAQEWQVPAGEITVDKGIIAHAASGHQARFGEFTGKAALLPVPGEVSLKDPKDFKLIGQGHLPRLDTPEKINGTAKFSLDIVLPGMVTALVQRPPLFGATVRSFDASGAKAVPGVLEVVQIPAGIAVVAKNFWAAKKGRDALRIEWEDGKAEKRGTAALFAEYAELAKSPGRSARRDGDPEAAFAKAAKTLSASFKFPYLAHAPMEPLNCVVRLDEDRCEIWAGDQSQTVDQKNAAKAAGLDPQQVTINTVYAGGSFGRRANPVSDYIVEAVAIAKILQAKSGGKAPPVKLVWTREDDIKGGRYRPAYFHALEAGLDQQGRLIAWRHRIVGQSILGRSSFFSQMISGGIDKTSVEGAATLPYAIDNLAVELHTTEVGVPVLWWRSVGSTHNAYSTEVFFDEIAEAAGKDPLALRRELLAKEKRHLGVLELAAAKAGWGDPLPKGKGRGIAVHKSFGTYVAQIAEVTVGGDGKIKIDRIVCAVDCGIAVNPDIVRAQMEGGIGFGLGTALHGAITLKDGAVEQSNFNDYQVLRIDEMPRVEVYILPSGEAPTGVGEPGVPPVAPAVANAIFAATGKRLRNLPMLEGGGV